MTRRRPAIALGSVLAAAVGTPPAADEDAAARVLDEAADHLRRFGLRRWSVDDVADAAAVGRTSVYRWFRSRDDLVHAVLARELRQTLDAIAAATAGAATFEDRAVEATLVCLDALDGSVVDHLVRNDPAAVLPLLTTDAGPLLDLARTALAPQLVAAGIARDATQATFQAEAMARLGLSFVLTRHTAVPVEDPVRLRAAVRSLLGPLLSPAG